MLRGEWHFSGVVVSDYTGDEEMIAHGFAKDGRDAARLAFLAGVDISRESNLYVLHLPALVRDGAVPQAAVDRAVRRVLAMKAALGLFDNPFRRIDPAREKARSRQPAALALAREAARKSIVMLRNEGGVLPLAKSAKVALIGPFGDGQHDIIGGWNVFGDDNSAVGLEAGLKAAGGQVTVVTGCAPDQPIPGGIEAAVTAACAGVRAWLACRRRSIRTCCAIPLPATFCNPAATCARCRSCWATPTSAPPRSIPGWISSTCPRSTTTRIRAPN